MSGVNLSPEQISWYRGGETDQSSRVIFWHMVGAPDQSSASPVDGADFARCVKLLQQFPEWRTRIHELAGISPVWAALVADWSELERMVTTKTTGLYTRIREIREAAGDDGFVGKAAAR